MKLGTAKAIDRSVVLVATLVLAGRQYGFPSKDVWIAIEKDYSYILITTLLVAGIFGALVPFEMFSGRARGERRVVMRRQILTTFGQLLEINASGTDQAPTSDLGLHIWKKKRTIGHPISGILVRIATYRLGSTPITRSISPTQGVGVVGLCWERDQEVGVNVEALAKGLDTPSAFEKFREDNGVAAVMGFSWEDFARFRHRGAVFASPIRNGRSRFVGCISFDAAKGFDSLNSNRMWHELNSLCVALGQDGFENV